MMFESAGWFPGRRVEVKYDRLDPLASLAIADAILREFAGLQVGKAGPGRDCAASDIEFYLRPSVDHRYAVAELEPDGADLFPLGEAMNGHTELFLDAAGRVFDYGVPCGSLWRVSDSFLDAVERWLLGIDRDAS